MSEPVTATRAEIRSIHHEVDAIALGKIITLYCDPVEPVRPRDNKYLMAQVDEMLRKHFTPPTGAIVGEMPLVMHEIREKLPDESRWTLEKIVKQCTSRPVRDAHGVRRNGFLLSEVTAKLKQQREQRPGLTKQVAPDCRSYPERGTDWGTVEKLHEKGISRHVAELVCGELGIAPRMHRVKAPASDGEKGKRFAGPWRLKFYPVNKIDHEIRTHEVTGRKTRPKPELHTLDDDEMISPIERRSLGFFDNYVAKYCPVRARKSKLGHQMKPDGKTILPCIHGEVRWRWTPKENDYIPEVWHRIGDLRKHDEKMKNPPVPEGGVLLTAALLAELKSEGRGRTKAHIRRLIVQHLKAVEQGDPNAENVGIRGGKIRSIVRHGDDKRGHDRDLYWMRSEDRSRIPLRPVPGKRMCWVWNSKKQDHQDFYPLCREAWEYAGLTEKNTLRSGKPLVPYIPREFGGLGQPPEALRRTIICDRLPIQSKMRDTMVGCLGDDLRVIGNKRGLPDYAPPKPPPPTSAAPSGRLSARDLAKAWGVSESAAASMLTRRRQADKGQKWALEVENAGPRNPRWLYLADAPEVVSIGEKLRRNSANRLSQKG